MTNERNEKGEKGRVECKNGGVRKKKHQKVEKAGGHKKKRDGGRMSARFLPSSIGAEKAKKMGTRTHFVHFGISRRRKET